ncbi:hypothetical protein [Shouchella clausii]|uniref:hypothetical protein n=1 Tax=Shouchella clausii TaxID=79880 RepID=UPI003183D393
MAEIFVADRTAVGLLVAEIFVADRTAVGLLVAGMTVADRTAADSLVAGMTVADRTAADLLVAGMTVVDLLVAGMTAVDSFAGCKAVGLVRKTAGTYLLVVQTLGMHFLGKVYKAALAEAADILAVLLHLVVFGHNRAALARHLPLAFSLMPSAPAF